MMFVECGMYVWYVCIIMMYNVWRVTRCGHGQLWLTCNSYNQSIIGNLLITLLV